MVIDLSKAKQVKDTKGAIAAIDTGHLFLMLLRVPSPHYYLILSHVTIFTADIVHFGQRFTTPYYQQFR